MRKCCAPTRVKVSSPDLPLKSLTVVYCLFANEIEIFAPNLQSFRFYGNFICMSFENISSLVDVLLNGRQRECFAPDDVWITVLHHLEHVQILTLCGFSLEYVDRAKEFTLEDLPITFHLQEFQLSVDQYIGGSLPKIYSFFDNCPCPCLEKLFIELPFAVEDPSQRDDTLKTLFDHLKVIKMNGFRGAQG